MLVQTVVGLESGADTHLAAERRHPLEDAGTGDPADGDVDDQRVVRSDRDAVDGPVGGEALVDLLEEVAALVEGGEHLALVGAGVDDLVVGRREGGRADDAALCRQRAVAGHLGEIARAGLRHVDPVGAEEQLVIVLSAAGVEDLLRVLREDGQVAGVVGVPEVGRREVEEAADGAALDGAFRLEGDELRLVSVGEFLVDGVERAGRGARRGVADDHTVPVGDADEPRQPHGGRGIHPGGDQGGAGVVLGGVEAAGDGRVDGHGGQVGDLQVAVDRAELDRGRGHGGGR